ncbi:NAD(P)-binding domain-containing protein [Reichenbachiella ulvae]|uniref:NAD(P)-binding domain-containing protein n=1 Tax=Reichenbachiella ulvae TaxID=2980104 RepID=A0ABT3CNW1_9BACT|nr:NAD(P)-binding domain-containing protein [Reichenbachiella ulvae]MCV9385405.1 NAD(P)-binding domain-containing protein [Reichenbachiella ulvae]
MNNQELPIAIIGGGPIGLAAAAQLALREKPFVLFESGEQIASNVNEWGHVRLFSPWEYNLDQSAETLLKLAGNKIPDKTYIPFGHELISDYLLPLYKLKGIQENIHLNTTVRSVGRKGIDKMKDKGREESPFLIQVEENGCFNSYEAKAVIDASGTWQNPNPLGSGGVFALGEIENRIQIEYGMPDILEKDSLKYADKSTLVVGGGHSAIGSILALNELKVDHPKTRIHWLLRKENLASIYGGKEADQFKARGALGIQIEELVNSGAIEIHTPVHIHQIEKTSDQLTIKGQKEGEYFELNGIDQIIGNTGSRPDFDFLREIRLEIDPALESVPKLGPLIDPNIHSCGTVRPHGEAELRQPEKDFYVVGMKSYGRAPTFLMTTGYEQVRSIIAHLHGEFESAQRVELKLPETGVCSSRNLPVVKKGKCKSNTCATV